MALVEITYFNPDIAAGFLVNLAMMAFETVGWDVYGKRANELETEDISVITQLAGPGSISAYLFEVKVSLATNDQPATAKEHEELAAQIGRALEFAIPLNQRYHVWVNNGALTGFYDGFGGGGV